MAPAPQPKKSKTGLIVVILIAVLIIGGLGSVAALGFAGKGPLKSLGSTPTPAATATPKATATPSIPPGFQAFTSSDNTFSLAYPGDWQKSDATQGTGGQFIGPQQQLFLVARQDGALSPTDFDNGFCGSSGFGGTGSTPKNVTIGGQGWTQEECDNSDGSGHAVVESVVYKGGFYYIAYVSDAASFAQNQTSFFTPMEQTFKFLT